MEGSRTATSAAAAGGSSQQQQQQTLADPFATPGPDNTENPFATPVAATPAAESVTSRQLGYTRNTSSFEGMYVHLLFFILSNNFQHLVVSVDASEAAVSKVNLRSHG